MMQERGSWPPVRGGLQMVLIAWLVNACVQLIHGLVFTVMVTGDGPRHETMKLVEVLGLAAGGLDLAAMIVVAIGMIRVAGAPEGIRAGGLATAGFALLLGSVLVSGISWVDWFLNWAEVTRRNFIPWEYGKYMWLAESALFTTGVILFLVAVLRVAAAVRQTDAAWKAIVAMAALGMRFLIVLLPSFVMELARFRFENRWAWFLLSRTPAILADVTVLLLVWQVARAIAPTSSPRRGP